MEEVVVTQLVDAARSGGAWAFERLYKTYAPSVAGYLRAQGAHDPEGLTNDVFVGVFRRIGSFEGDSTAFRSWVFTIAHHRLVDDRWRRRRRVATAPLDDANAAMVGGDVEADALAVLGETECLALLRNLPPDQRSVLALRVIADLSIEDTARIIGKRQTAVKALQRRALARLRNTISAEPVSR